MQREWRGAAESSLLGLVARFQSEGSAVDVNFRQLVSSDGGANKSAHAIHPYPAKLLVNIPQFFLAAIPTAAGSLLLDPFCGSGTVLYEGALAGLRPVGSDSNPLARLVTRAKLTPLDRDVARRQLNEVMAAYPSASPTIPDVVNRDYWFSERVSDCLGRLKTAIERSVLPQCRPVFDVSFSATVRRVSYADPRLSVPVKINPERSARYGAKGDEVIRRLERLAKIDVGAVFWSIAGQNIQRCPELGQGFAADSPEIFSDARSLEVAEASVGLAITSPPYVGAQKYVRASSLSLGWLGLTPDCRLRPIERQSIGREHLSADEGLEPSGTGVAEADCILDQIAERNPLRARIAQRYLLEMRDALYELARTMSDGGSLILVVGPNLVAGLEFPTPFFLQRIAESHGFSTQLHLIDSIESRGLMTKRNRTAGVIQQESVFLLKRVRDSA
jgi:DNA modification methylase